MGYIQELLFLKRGPDHLIDLSGGDGGLES